MKKTMKWVLGLILTLVMPCTLMAETVNVGVSITEVPTIDVVTTLSADIKVRVVNQIIEDSYISVTNNGTSQVAVSITDIEAISEGAPSEFVEYNRDTNPLKDANEAETATKIAFGISDGTNWETIYPETSIYLGEITSASFVGGRETGPQYDSQSTYVPTVINESNLYPLFYDGNNIELTKTFAVSAETGYSWSTEQSLEYAITMVVENASSVNDYPSEIFTDGSGLVYYKILGDYEMNADGSGITNTLKGLAFEVSAYGDLNFNKITFQYASSTVSTYFNGDYDPFGSRISNYDTDTHSISAYAIVTVPYEDFVGDYHPITITAYNCENLDDNSTCTEVATWGHIFYVPEV